MELSGFYNAVETEPDVFDKVYFAKDFAEYFKNFISNGVFFAETGDELQVFATGDNFEISINEGRAFIEGYWYKNTTPLTKMIELADSTGDRIDSVVLRLNLTTRKISLDIVKGAVSGSPVPPEIVRTEEIYELRIANIRVEMNALSISQKDITDARLMKSECGAVTGLIEQADLSTIFYQFSDFLDDFKTKQYADFEQWTAEQKAQYELFKTESERQFNEWFSTNTLRWTSDFSTWFDGIKGKLSTDIAGSLQNQIDLQHEQFDRFLEMQFIPKTDELYREVASLKSGIQKTNESLNGFVADFDQKLDTKLSKNFPVGYVYLSFTNISPSEMFGGVWEQLDNVFLYATKQKSGVKGGENTHTLTVNEMPRHRHSMGDDWSAGASPSGKIAYKKSSPDDKRIPSEHFTDYQGSGMPFNNMPQYITVYAWRKVR